LGLCLSLLRLGVVLLKGEVLRKVDCTKKRAIEEDYKGKCEEYDPEGSRSLAPYRQQATK
jgi:hypothetical protein